MTLTVVTYPARVLSRPARRVKPGEIHDLPQLFAEMVEAMREYHGIGLAAPQVGRSIRFLIAQNPETREVHGYVNPQIVASSLECETASEGCLSFPGLYGDVSRPVAIRLRFQDLDFNEHEEDFTDYHARIIQHEIDHLNGILLVDRAEDGLHEWRPEEEAEEAAAEAGTSNGEVAPDDVCADSPVAETAPLRGL